MSVERLFRRVWNALAFVSVTQVDDSGPVMMLQATIGTMETVNLPAPQQFGFSSVPPLGSDAAAHFVGGDRSNGAITTTNHQPTRPTGKLPGESQQFDAFGKSIYLTQNNGIVINANGAAVTINNATTVTINASSEVVMNTPLLTVSGDIHATGEIIRGFGTGDQAGLGTHRHGTGTAAAGTVAPTAGT